MWIVDWSLLVSNKRYLCCAIGTSKEGCYLYHPEILLGWRVKRLMPKCYAAVEMPAFSCEAVHQHPVP